jgi:hypothetical protein
VVLPYFTAFSRHCEEPLRRPVRRSFLAKAEAIQHFLFCSGIASLALAMTSHRLLNCTTKELSDYRSFMRRHAMVRRMVLAKD